MTRHIISGVLAVAVMVTACSAQWGYYGQRYRYPQHPRFTWNSYGDFAYYHDNAGVRGSAQRAGMTTFYRFNNGVHGTETDYGFMRTYRFSDGTRGTVYNWDD